jgi:hypothetical protein
VENHLAVIHVLGQGLAPMEMIFPVWNSIRGALNVVMRVNAQIMILALITMLRSDLDNYVQDFLTFQEATRSIRLGIPVVFLLLG